MSRKRDPVIGVIRYFQEAELPLAEQALTLCQQAVRARQGGKRNDARPRKPTLAAAKPAAATAGSSAD